MNVPGSGHRVIRATDRDTPVCETFIPLFSMREAQQQAAKKSDATFYKCRFCTKRFRKNTWHVWVSRRKGHKNNIEVES